VLHVATVHYRSPRWIEIQTSHLLRYLPIPYQTWTSLEGIDNSYAASFDRVLEQRGPHAGKLNHLAMEICDVAADDDLIMFLDGDAFPIADPMPVVMDALEKAPLVAVRRAENLDDPQPHPCFCVTTVGAWRSLRGDWSPGPVWPGVQGRRVTDVGANLLRALELSETPWVQLLRTNGSKLHPVFFAVYGEIVYHHGAGFRGEALSRADLQQVKAEAAARGSQHPARRWLRAGIARARGRGRADPRRGLSDRNNERSRLIFEAIESGEPGWLALVTDDQARQRASDQPVTRGRV
jgi:hypothetical protein